MAPDYDTHYILRGVAQHDPDILQGMLQARLSNLEQSGLDERTYSLVNLAALIAQDGAPASYVWHVGLALDAGVTPEEILGLLVALNPTLGNARIVAAAPELALALGIDLDLLEQEIEEEETGEN